MKHKKQSPSLNVTKKKIHIMDFLGMCVFCIKIIPGFAMHQIRHLKLFLQLQNYHNATEEKKAHFYF